MMHGWIYKSIRAAVFAATLLASIGAGEGDATSNEYRLKAAFIYNFAQFTQWPDGAFAKPDAPLVIAILGKNPFGTMLDETVKGKKIGQHPVIVKLAKSAEDARDSQVLFVATSEEDRFDDTLKALGKRPILTIAESPRFQPAGGMIQLLLEDDKIRFSVNPDAADVAGLKISSKLLKLARIYKK
jgi:hypothetical protein